MHDTVRRAWVNTRPNPRAVAWLSSGCDWDFRPQNMTHQKYKHMHNTGTVKQSCRYITHGLYGCAAHWHIMCSANTWDMMQLTPRWHGQMKHFRRIFQHALGPLLSEFQHRNCESGNNTRNSAIEEVGCSGSMSSPLVNHFWIRSIRAASDLQHDVRYIQTDI